MTPRLIYILGAGRSGSTVLERLLASAPGVVGVGELHALWRARLSSLTCACGAPAIECAFWRSVRAEAGFDERRIAELSGLERRAVRHSRLLAARAGFGRRSLDADLARFLDLQRRLFRAIGVVAGAHTLVDSSKAAPRAWALSALPDALIIHLRRNPTDVIRAWRRVKIDPSLGGPMHRPAALIAALDWLKAEHSSRLLSRRRLVHRVAFEKLARAPRDVLRGLPEVSEGVAWLGESRFAPDPDYHALNGNPDRFSRGAIEIEAPAPADLDGMDRLAARALGAGLRAAAP